MANNKLTLENISFGYDKKTDVLREVSLNIESGKITALLGANGCGKSTAFHVMTGRLKPHCGVVKLDGTDIQGISRREYARKIASVNQYNTAPDDMTVQGLVELGRTPYRRTCSFSLTKEDKQAVEKALLFTDLSDLKEQTVNSLSGGQKQRVWLALALAQSPELLLLDEITTYLDIKYQYEILNLIKRLNETACLTVVMVLHDINQAMEYSDNAVLMKEGSVIVSGRTAEVITKENLDNTFDVNTSLSELNGRRICFINT